MEKHSERCFNVFRKRVLTKNITIHSLRHSFASNLLRETKNIRIAKKELGHVDLS